MLVKRNQRGEGRSNAEGGSWTEEWCVWRANVKTRSRGTSAEEAQRGMEGKYGGCAQRDRGERRGGSDDEGRCAGGTKAGGSWSSRKVRACARDGGSVRERESKSRPARMEKKAKDELKKLASSRSIYAPQHLRTYRGLVTGRSVRVNRPHSRVASHTGNGGGSTTPPEIDAHRPRTSAYRGRVIPRAVEEVRVEVAGEGAAEQMHRQGAAYTAAEMGPVGLVWCGGAQLQPLPRRIDVLESGVERRSLKDRERGRLCC
ncbi:hypothetical protein B0H13DRAFT_2287406 [Mycena leptocephala]|nr:hypothetical protein B0H13DRAFT_2287406 [Mycena leptocephala]